MALHDPSSSPVVRARRTLWYASVAVSKRVFVLDRRRWSARTLPQLEALGRERQLTMQETLRRVRDGASLARYGDGEFAVMDGWDIPFQDTDPTLRAELASLLSNRLPGLLVGLPQLADVRTCEESDWWLRFWYRMWPRVRGHLSETTYANSMVTRPEFFVAHGMEGEQSWRAVWAGRPIVIVTGEGSRMDLHHDLFAGATDRVELLSTARHAYADLPRLEQQIRDLPEAGSRLILISLGVAATVLAARLHRAGFQALDIGHLTNSCDEGRLRRQAGLGRGG